MSNPTYWIQNLFWCKRHTVRTDEDTQGVKVQGIPRILGQCIRWKTHWDGGGWIGFLIIIIIYVKVQSSPPPKKKEPIDLFDRSKSSCWRSSSSLLNPSHHQAQLDGFETPSLSAISQCLDRVTHTLSTMHPRRFQTRQLWHASLHTRLSPALFHTIPTVWWRRWCPVLRSSSSRTWNVCSSKANSNPSKHVMWYSSYCIVHDSEL